MKSTQTYEKNCTECGTPFTITEKQKTKMYCSDKCTRAKNYTKKKK